MNQKWDLRYIHMASVVATWSKDPSTKSGCVIVHPLFGIVSAGFNGFARGVSDDDRLNDRETKYKMVVHCERNALLFAQRDLTDCSIYVHPWMPCGACAGMIIQSGIRRCVSIENDSPRWQADFDITRKMFSEAGIELVMYPASA